MYIPAASLAFVQGVAAASITEATRFVYLSEKQILTTDGIITLAAPASDGFKAQPNRDAFFRVIKTMGKHGVNIEQLPTTLMLVGEHSKARHKLPYAVNDDLLTAPTAGPYRRFSDPRLFRRALERLLPFVGDDNTHPWARGIMLRDGLAHVTNNVVICRHTAPMSTEGGTSVLLPLQMVREILRADEPPIAYAYDESTMTVVWSGQCWMKGSLLEDDWTSGALEFLDAIDFGGCRRVPEALRDAVKTLHRVVDEARELRLEGRVLRTSKHEHGSEIDIDVDGLIVVDSMFLSLVLGVADEIDLSTYPNPIPFFSADRHLYGAFMGKQA